MLFRSRVLTWSASGRENLKPLLVGSFSSRVRGTLEQLTIRGKTYEEEIECHDEHNLIWLSWNSPGVDHVVLKVFSLLLFWL